MMNNLAFTCSSQSPCSCLRLVLGILLLPGLLLAQEADTMLLEEVEILGIPTEKYTVGSKVNTIDSMARVSQVNGSLQDLLQQETPLYLKEYGYGMASTISLRGTSASHTAVLWNGLNLNSYTLGAADFSNLPVFMFDQVQVHYGGGSAFYGSDALGGSIVLQSQTEHQEGYGGQLLQTLGSFGQFVTGFKARWGSADWQLTTRLYRHQAENDFPFENTAKFGAPQERQENAGVHNIGLMQELSYHPTSRQKLSIHAWYEESENGVLPQMSNNLKPETYERITDRHLRLSAQYQHRAPWGYLQVTAGYVRDYQQYDVFSPIQADRTLARLQFDRNLSQKLSLKLGADWQYIQAEAENYARTHYQHRADAFAALRYQPMAWWDLSLQLRQAWVSAYRAPLAPSLGSEIQLLAHRKAELVWKQQVSRSYRIPTFNDLFWEPGGNPDLRAEQAWSYESGLLFERQQFRAEATYFHSSVDDWIIWLDQGSFWRPQNFREVSINGLETRLHYRLQWEHGQLQWDGFYTLTAALNQTPIGPFDRSAGKQLPYVPRHRTGLNTRVQRQDWSLALFAQWTSARFLTTTNESLLEGYALFNLRLNRDFDWWQTRWSVSGRINNLLNSDYQNVARRAMPGRYYQLSLQLFFSN